MIKELIEKIVDVPSPYNTKRCIVTEVDTDARTCDVEPTDGTATIFDVRLQATINSTIGIVFFPVKDSEVVVTLLNNETGYVSAFSEVEKGLLTIGDQEILFDKNGLKLSKSSSADLKEQLDKMFDLQASILDLLFNFQLMTNMGVTVQVMPNIQAQIKQLKTTNEEIKNNIGQIIQ